MCSWLPKTYNTIHTYIQYIQYKVHSGTLWTHNTIKIYDNTILANWVELKGIRGRLLKGTVKVTWNIYDESYHFRGWSRPILVFSAVPVSRNWKNNNNNYIFRVTLRLLIGMGSHFSVNFANTGFSNFLMKFIISSLSNNNI